MMNPWILAGAILLPSLGLNAAVNSPEKPGKVAAAEPAPEKADLRNRTKASETVCALSITWWEEPTLNEGESMELGIQTDRGVVRIAPVAMSSGGAMLYEGPATVAIVRKAMLPDPSGKPGAPLVETWLPFTSFKLGAEDREVLAILFANQGQVRTRSININQENFPFGGFHIYNYTKTRLLCNMGNKVFNSEPSSLTLSPLVMSKREVVNFFLGVKDDGEKMRIIYRAPLVLTEKIRRLYFVLENIGADSENRYTTRTIMQHVSSHKTVETLRNPEANPLKQALKSETTPEPSPTPDKNKQKQPAPQGT